MKSSLLFILFFSISICCFAQKRTLTGTIYDDDKNPLAFANVIIKNSEKGVISNEKGQFTIDSATKDILEISYLGFETKEIKVADQKDISVVLKTSNEVMDVVEIVGYGSISCNYRIACRYPKIVETISKSEATDFKRIQGEQRLNALFPNPSVSGIFQLQLNENYAKLTLEVFNMNGQLVQSNTFTKLSKNPQIDLSKQAKGMYLVRIIADGTVLETKKAVKL